MENPGCITLEESRYLLESKTTQYKLFRRAYIFLHELAHIWFGDLVTIEFWNDLYLKEGFATFLGAKAVYSSHYLLSQIPSSKRTYYLEDVLIFDAEN
jgi:aminopeptidase N